MLLEVSFENTKHSTDRFGYQLLIVIGVTLINLLVWSYYVNYGILLDEWAWRISLKWIPAFMLLMQTIGFSLLQLNDKAQKLCLVPERLCSPEQDITCVSSQKLCLFYTLCVVGDVMMAFESMMWLMGGMFFFGLAYIVLMWVGCEWRDETTITPWWKLLVSAIPYCVLGLCNFPILSPILSRDIPLLMGVIGYSVIMLMAGTITLTGVWSSLGRSSILLASGTAFLILADTLLVENLMVFSSSLLDIMTITLYWSGLMIIGVSPLS